MKEEILGCEGRYGGSDGGPGLGEVSEYSASICTSGLYTFRHVTLMFCETLPTGLRWPEALCYQALDIVDLCQITCFVVVLLAEEMPARREGRILCKTAIDPTSICHAPFRQDCWEDLRAKKGEGCCECQAGFGAALPMSTKGLLLEGWQQGFLQRCQ